MRAKGRFLLGRRTPSLPSHARGDAWGHRAGAERKHDDRQEDLKTRIRDRVARTGESYVTARRHVIGDLARPKPAMQVVEMLDLTDAAARLGMRCKVSMSSTLAKRAEPAAVLASVRDALVGTAGDPSTALLRDVGLAGKRPPPPVRSRDFEGMQRFMRRARAGLGGTTADGATLALPIAGHAGMVPVLCSIRHRQRRCC